MSTELRKRIITSIVFFIIAILLILINKIIFAIGIFVIITISFLEWNKINYKYFSKKKKKDKFIYIKIVGVVYLFIFFISSMNIRMEYGKIFFIFILCICVCSDIGGYVFGKTFGGKKLIKISPNKTISGSLGSFCFSIFPLLLFYNFDPSKYLYSTNNFLLCLEISLVCQLGDLFVSYIKRKAKVKDTGRILPGHGGVLDRVDGIIIAIPFVFIYLNGFSEYVEIWRAVFS